MPRLAAKIKQAQQDIDKATTEASFKTIFAGNSLIEAKALVKHGEWLPFLKEARIHERTAQRWMTLAESKLESDFVSDLGGRQPLFGFCPCASVPVKAFYEAEVSALAGDGALEPIERAFNLIEKMVAMLPSGSQECTP